MLQSFHGVVSLSRCREKVELDSKSICRLGVRYETASLCDVLRGESSTKLDSMLRVCRCLGCMAEYSTYLAHHICDSYQIGISHQLRICDTEIRPIRRSHWVKPVSQLDTHLSPEAIGSAWNPPV